MRQWWLGRAVPMAGVSGVTVAPEYRGRGIGRMLMTALLDEIAAQGYPLSALFPATMPLYRSVGWELAGARDTAVIPARSLLRLVPPDAQPPEAGTVPATGLRRAGPGDAEAVVAVLGRVHEAARDCGPITWDTDSAADWLADPGLYAYLAEDGFLAYRWQRGNKDLYVGARRGDLGRTARALWTHARLARLDSGAGLRQDRPGQRVLVAHPGARRGHRAPVPSGCSGWSTRPRPSPPAASPPRPRSPSRCASPTRPARPTPALAADRVRRTAAARLTRCGRRPEPPAHRTASPAVTLGARGLAALYAGTPLVTLRQAGLAAGGTAADDAALDAAFAATPYMLDAF